MHVKPIITPFNPTINGLRTKGNKNRETWNLNAQYDDYKENIGLQQVNRIIIQDRKLQDNSNSFALCASNISFKWMKP